MYKKYRHLDTDIHVYIQEENEYPRLLQSDVKYPLSKFYSDDERVACIVNCSYFTNDYVLGRNQGDLKNDTHDQPDLIDLVFLKDGSYKLGNFKSWDYQNNVIAGFTVATVLVENGVAVSKISTAIEGNSKLTSRNPQTAVGVLKDGKVMLIVSDGRTSQNKGLTGYELRDYILDNYDIELLCQLDGGGSSEMIVDSAIVSKPSDGAERPMFNGLAIVMPYEKLKCPFKKMAIIQYDGEDFSHKGSDAWDISTGTAGVKDPYFAPCDLVCKEVEKSSASVWWQSKNKVQFADGTKDYMTLMVVHDNTINQYVGMKINQGVQIGNMGTGGGATGVHCHIEVAKGKYKGKYYKNEYGVYCLFNTCKFYEAFFMDNVEIVGYSKSDDYRWALLDEVKKKFKYISEEVQEELLKVIDVSYYQSNIDYKKVKDNGIQGAIIRCGRTGWGEFAMAKDSLFEKHYKGFKDVNMPVGAYYYSCANTIELAKKEANFVLDIIKGKKFEFPIYFDVENNERQGSLSKQALTDITKAFCEVIEKAGYYVGIYASKSWLETKLDMSQLKDYDVWVAQYNTSCTYKGTYGMWQYTSSGKVNGINGNVDMNKCYKDYPSIIKKAGLNGYGVDEVAELKKQIATLTSQLNQKEIEIVKLEEDLGKVQSKLNDIKKIVNQ